MQLYALLESLELYVSGIDTTIVIYRSSNEKFEDAYNKVHQAFKDTAMIKQAEPLKDFKPLTLNAFNKSSNEFIMFAVDDLIVTDYFDVSKAIDLIEKTGSYGFYYKMGKNLSHCYTWNCPQVLPTFNQLNQDVSSWQFCQGYADWAYPNTLDMTLYRKKDIQDNFKKMDYCSPNGLEACWAGCATNVLKCLGLCFENSKVVNIPLNIVQKHCKNRNMNHITTEQLLEIFESGQKIDIHALYKVKNTAVHMEYKPQFVERVK